MSRPARAAAPSRVRTPWAVAKKTRGGRPCRLTPCISATCIRYASKRATDCGDNPVMSAILEALNPGYVAMQQRTEY
jgi:hypothetical protein